MSPDTYLALYGREPNYQRGERQAMGLVPRSSNPKRQNTRKPFLVRLWKSLCYLFSKHQPK